MRLVVAALSTAVAKQVGQENLKYLAKILRIVCNRLFPATLEGEVSASINLLSMISVPKSVRNG